jgi:outer membrane protein assembly factor BamB
MMKIGNPENSYPGKRLPGIAKLIQKLAGLRPVTSRNGSTLLYIVVVMVIFGFLGVTMVTLFSTSTVSSGTPNDARRALYLAESGARYAVGELRNNGFSQDVINRFNLPTTYSVSGAGTFTVNVFGPWFESTATDSVSGGAFQLTVPEGRLPADFTIPAGASIVNANYVGLFIPDDAPQSAQVQSFTKVDDTHLVVTLAAGDDFAARRDERICLAFKSPYSDYDVTAANRVVNLPLAAKDIFPKRDGAIRIDRVDYVYTERNDKAGQIELTNIQPLDGGSLSAFTVKTNHYVMVSPQNHLVVPTGTAEGVSSGLASNRDVSVFDTALPEPGQSEADLPKLDPVSKIEPSGSNLVSQDATAQTLDIGHGIPDAFGGAWYAGSTMIGGDPDFCVSGKCRFNFGVRVFFTLTYSGTGQGFVFTLVNADNNGLTSIGGDGDAPELLGYAGDSRYSGGFLDGTTDGKGLQPPKVGVEFDAQPNNSEPLYCNGSTLNTGTRDDPLTGSQDAVDYVFWGRNDSLNIPCRDNDVTYDDNKHNTHGSAADLTNIWSHDIGGNPALLRPAIGSDGSIYIANEANQLVAIKPDGSAKWTRSLGGSSAAYNPGIDPADDTLYVDYAMSQIAAVNPADGSVHLTDVGADFDSTPVVGSDDRIYFGTKGGRGLRYSYDRGSGSWIFRNEYQVYGQADSRPAIGPGGQIYIVAWGDGAAQRGSLYAFNPATASGLGNWIWRYDILQSGSLPNGSYVLSSPAISRDGSTIYVGSNDDYLYAVNSNGTLKWRHFAAGDVQSSPAVASDGTIIFGSDTGHVSAIIDSGNGSTFKWDYPTSGAVVSSPIIDPNDGTIYVGSNDHKLYAFNPDSPAPIWQFPTGAEIKSSPNIGPDGTIYVASNDHKVYGLQDFAKPRNYKINPLESGNTEKYLVTADDLDATLPLPIDRENWLTNGPWAVRVEVNRSTTPNGNGNYEYTLRTWLRQCNDEDCNTDNSHHAVKGTFFEDTRIEYDAHEPQLAQTIELTPAEHDQFDRFLFGFTTASGPGEDQSAVIGNYQLSFIRPNDPVVHSDPAWP